MSAPEAAESRIGTVLDDRYRLDAVLGMGGFGTVYRARHLALDHDVAIKLLHAGVSANAAKRLTREAKVLARLAHPNTVRIMDFGSHDGAPYLVTELVIGHPLSDALGKSWAPRRAVDTTLELLAGLVHAHALGLVHRDLKPDNVLLVDDPQGGATVKIIDFGIVAIAAGEQLGSFTEQLTATGRIVGTPRYMSPEQLLGTKIDARSDLYAIGLLLYEMLVGQPAFDSPDPRQLAWLHVVAPPPLLPDGIPDELAELIDELLAKKPELRPASAARVHERLLALRDSLDSRPSVPMEFDSHSVESGPQQRVGRFVVLRELARGGTGSVYLGWDETLDRAVAIKLLRPTPEGLRANARILREARGLARVTHPNVVGIYEFGSHLGQLFVAMQYVSGRTLRVWQSERPRAWTETLARLIEAGRGLAAVHVAGLVHRDFKPENVIIGLDERARVADFGLVRAASPAFDMVDRLAPGWAEAIDTDPLDAKLTRTGTIIGTPAYMALEQLAGDRVDARSDQFAFCVVAYELLFGVRPFNGETLEELAAKLTAGHIEARPNDGAVPREIVGVLARGLQVMPASRWPSMDALLDKLEQAVDVHRNRSMRWVIVAGVISFGLIVAAAWKFGGRDAPIHDEQLERRNHELEQELDRTRAELARAKPEDPKSWRDAIELAARHRDAMPLEVRASLHAVAAAIHDGYPLRELGEVDVLVWAPTRPLLALARREGGIAVWDADERRLVRMSEHGGPLDSPVFSHNGEFLVARDRRGRAILWHVSTGATLGVIEEPGLRIAKFVSDTQEIVIVSDAGVSLWGLVRVRELERSRVVTDEEDVLALAGSDQTVPDRTWLGNAGAVEIVDPTGSRVAIVGDDGIAWVWNRTSVDVSVEADPTAIPGPPSLDPSKRTAVSRDGRRIATATGARPSSVVVSTHDGQQVVEWQTNESEIRALAFSPDGTLLAVGGAEVHLWQIDAAFDLATLARGRLPVRALAFGADGRKLAIVYEDGTQIFRWIDELALFDAICSALESSLGERPRGCHSN